VLEVIKNYSPDIIQFNILRVLDDEPSHGKPIKCHNLPDGLYMLSSIRENVFGVGKWFPYTRVFKREIMKQYPFPSKRIFYEDLITLPFILLQDFSIYFLENPLISYRNNPKSTTRNHKPEHGKTLLDLFNTISALPKSCSRYLIRVQLARSIVFFTLELRLRDVPLDSIRRQVRAMENKSILSAYLSWADILFLRFPLMYTLLEWVRRRF